MRNFRKADSARNWRDLQNRMADVPPDSLVAVRNRHATGGAAVEMDEMYYGGTSKGHSGRPMRGDKQKTPVIGIVERSSKARHRQSKGFGYARSICKRTWMNIRSDTIGGIRGT